MQDDLQDLVSRTEVLDHERNVPRPDFHRILYLYRAGTHVLWAGRAIWVPAGWLVIDRLKCDTD